MDYQFEFNGDWVFKETFDIFRETLCFGGFGNEPIYRNSIEVKLFDREDFDPDPEPEQINTLKFIKLNQEKLLEKLLEYTLNVIYPFHKQYMDDEDFYPTLNSIFDLKQVYGLDKIFIHNEYTDDFAYFTLVFNSFSPDEHGQHLTFHKYRLVHFADTCHFDKIIEDLPEEKAKIERELNKKSYENTKIQELIFQYPIPKYNKLKPWQEDINEFYSCLLVHQERLDLLTQYIDKILPNLKIDANRELKYLKYIAESNKKSEVVKLLQEKIDKIEHH